MKNIEFGDLEIRASRRECSEEYWKDRRHTAEERAERTKLEASEAAYKERESQRLSQQIVINLDDLLLREMDVRHD